MHIMYDVQNAGNLSCIYKLQYISFSTVLRKLMSSVLRKKINEANTYNSADEDDVIWFKAPQQLQRDRQLINLLPDSFLMLDNVHNAVNLCVNISQLSKIYTQNKRTLLIAEHFSLSVCYYK